MTWLAVIRGACAILCALGLHAVLVAGAVYLGWFSSDNATLPELDITSVDLSFSETPEETATPAAQPPSPAVEPTPPTPPPAFIEPLPPPPAVEFPPAPAVEPPPPPAIKPPPLTPPAVEPPPPAVEPPQSQQARPPSVEVPPVPAPSQARVAVDKPPSPRRRIKPEYPKGARQRGEEGDVTLELDISANGTVDGVRIVASCGFAELEQAAVQAVKQARFEPARRGSQKVPSTARLTLTFRLKD